MRPMVLCNGHSVHRLHSHSLPQSSRNGRRQSASGGTLAQALDNLDKRLAGFCDRPQQFGLTGVNRSNELIEMTLHLRQKLLNGIFRQVNAIQNRLVGGTFPGESCQRRPVRSI